MARDRTLEEPASAEASLALISAARERDRLGHEEPPLDVARAFSEGELVGRRYRVVRFLAAGGMGEVYEAIDEELGGPIALKAMRGERATDARAVERFRREISFARRITHPNVARFFDVGFHRDERSQRSIAFLTMELLAGESLSERLLRGPLREAEALPLAIQIAAALDAAHAAGVVHRDLKSSNVMLVPSPELGSSARAVVTDFGLARSAESPDHSLSRDVQLLGSPPYMAPEQVQGGDITPATDVYAFGVVLYEAMTGALPFVADSPMTTALMRLTRDPKKPREIVPTLDARFERVILKCLQREPEKRFARAGEVAEALQAPESRAPRSRTLVTFGAGLLLLAASAAGVHQTRTRLAAPPIAPATSASSSTNGADVRRSIAVLGFEGAASEAWLDATLVQQMSTLLAAGDTLRVVSPSRVAAARHESGLDEAKNIAAAPALARLRENLHADRTVTGTYAIQDGASRTLQLEVVVKEGADTIAAARVSGPLDSISDLTARVTKELRTKLGVREPSLEEIGLARAALPRNPEAARLYAQGMFEQQRFQYAAARDLLRKATEAAPDFAPAYAALASAVGGTGRDEEAAALAEKARSLSAGLSRPDRLAIEADLHRLRSDFEHAASVYQALFTFYPDEVEYGVNLMRSQTKAGRPLDALQTVNELRKLPAGLRDDPRIDFEEARAGHVSSNYPLSLAAATKALDEGKKRGNLVLVGQAGYFYGIALDALGRPEEGRKALLEAREASKSIGDAYNLGVLQSPIHGFHLARGELAEARKEMVEVEASLTDMGQTYYAAASRTKIAGLDLLEGDVEGARTKMEEAIATLRRVNGAHALGGALPELAEIYAHKGEYAAAKRACEEALVITRKAGRKTAESGALLTLAHIARMQGDLATAKANDELALRLNREASFTAGIASALLATAERQTLEGDHARARLNAEEALKTMTTLGDELAASEAKIALSRIALAERKPAEAVRLAGQAEARLRAAGAHGLEARATEARVRAMRARAEW